MICEANCIEKSTPQPNQLKIKTMTDEKKPELRPASENPWYILATIAGEPRSSSDRQTIEKNRYYWNGFMRSMLSDEEIESSGLSQKLPQLTDEDFEKIDFSLCSKGFEAKIISKLEEIDFSNTNFDKEVNFPKFVFARYTIFDSSNFSKSAGFYSSVFLKTVFFHFSMFTVPVSFCGVIFSGGAYFDSAVFSGSVSFDSSTFSDVASFRSSIFIGSADFRYSTFTKLASFDYSTFTVVADFFCSTFIETASFHFSTFTRGVFFHFSIFTGITDFQSSIFKLNTKFSYAEFNQAPQFYETNLYEDTDWHGVQWPKKPKNEKTARESKRAYQRLALIMSKLEKPTDQHMFFRKEMEAQRVEDWFNRNWISWAASKFFSMVSDYGFGVGRALACWFGQMFVGAFLLFVFCFKTDAIGTIFQWEFWRSLKYSFANSHSFLGLNRVFFSDELKVLKEKGNVLEPGSEALYAFNAIGATQTVFGVVFLFFLLLTIRNKFRMK